MCFIKMFCVISSVHMHGLNRNAIDTIHFAYICMNIRAFFGVDPSHSVTTRS